MSNRKSRRQLEKVKQQKLNLAITRQIMLFNSLCDEPLVPRLKVAWAIACGRKYGKGTRGHR